MVPQKEIYRDVEIRYGYSIQDDLFHAHFDAPVRDRRTAFQSSVSTDLPPVLTPPKPHVTGTSPIEVLDRARAQIDRYLGIS